jgi:hypothetical protein
MGRVLTCTFIVPVKKYKGSNTMSGNRFLAEAKTRWLRGYGETVWAEAIREQHGIVAVEPAPESYVIERTPTQEETDVGAQLAERKAIVDDRARLCAQLSGMKPRMTIRAGATHETIDLWKADLRNANADLRVARKAMTALQHEHDKLVKHNSGHAATMERKRYLKEKKRLNEGNLLFPGQVVVRVRSNVVTNHEFDAPNSWPAVKPLQDGGTDTCVLWHDDNNDFIVRTEFYGGHKASRDNYVIEMIAESVEGFHDPFGAKIVL